MRRFLAMHDFVKDSSGEYAAVYRPYHLIGLELGISVATVVLRGEATGTADYLMADVVAVAKKDLKPGDSLDGEGGFTAYGRLVSADRSIPGGYLPIGLSQGGKLRRPVAKDSILTYQDVTLDVNRFSYRMRRTLEDDFKSGTGH
jgi:predicted homoserine dehydrogenase-like protein